MLVQDEDYSILSVNVFDVYGLENNKKSVAITVKIQPLRRTFSKSELDEIYNSIVDRITGQTKAILRG